MRRLEETSARSRYPLADLVHARERLVAAGPKGSAASEAAARPLLERLGAALAEEIVLATAWSAGTRARCVAAGLRARPASGTAGWWRETRPG